MLLSRGRVDSQLPSLMAGHAVTPCLRTPFRARKIIGGGFLHKAASHKQALVEVWVLPP